MKHWGSALFPLSVLSVLALLTLWLRFATEFAEPRQDGKHRHDPDYIVENATLSKINDKGNLQYTLKAREIRHFPDDETTALAKPDVILLRPKRPNLTAKADRGLLSNDNEQVDLYDNVRIHREATAKEAAMTATTSQLTILTEEEKAFTKSPVLITKGNSWLKGVGMQIDNRAQTYLLESRASALLENKHSKKQKP